MPKNSKATTVDVATHKEVRMLVQMVIGEALVGMVLGLHLAVLAIQGLIPIDPDHFPAGPAAFQAYAATVGMLVGAILVVTSLAVRGNNTKDKNR